MVRRRMARVALIIAVTLLALTFASWVLPFHYARGAATNLPAWFIIVRKGGVEYGSFSSLPQSPGIGFEGGTSNPFYHWIRLYAQSATIDGSTIVCASGVTTQLSDSRLPLDSASPVVVANMCYSKLQVFPFTFLAASVVFCLYPSARLLWGWRRRSRWRRRGRCTGCGYDLTGNTSGVCPECGCATKLGKGGLHDGTVT